MAQAELRDGKAPEMRKMAQNIIAAQKKEIAPLDRFLAKNGRPVDKMSKESASADFSGLFESSHVFGIALAFVACWR